MGIILDCLKYMFGFETDKQIKVVKSEYKYDNQHGKYKIEFRKTQELLDRYFIRRSKSDYFRTLEGKCVYMLNTGYCMIIGGRRTGLIIPPMEHYIKVNTLDEMKTQCDMRGIKDYSDLTKKQIEKLLETTQPRGIIMPGL